MGITTDMICKLSVILLSGQVLMEEAHLLYSEKLGKLRQLVQQVAGDRRRYRFLSASGREMDLNLSVEQNDLSNGDIVTAVRLGFLPELVVLNEVKSALGFLSWEVFYDGTCFFEAEE